MPENLKRWTVTLKPADRVLALRGGPRALIRRGDITAAKPGDVLVLEGITRDRKIEKLCDGIIWLVLPISIGTYFTEIAGRPIPTNELDHFANSFGHCDAADFTRSYTVRADPYIGVLILWE